MYRQGVYLIRDHFPVSERFVNLSGCFQLLSKVISVNCNNPGKVKDKIEMTSDCKDSKKSCGT